MEIYGFRSGGGRKAVLVVDGTPSLGLPSRLVITFYMALYIE